MADHTITLSSLREDALQQILNDLNNQTTPPGTMTKDDLLREWCLAPIKERIRSNRANTSETIVTAYEAATPTVQDQVEALLGITLP